MLNDTVIAEYYDPGGLFLASACKELGLTYDRNLCIEFLKQIKFCQIQSTSKPASYFPTNDTTGFSCFSIIFCGNDDPENTEKIKRKINEDYFDKNYSVIDKEIMKNVIYSPTMKEEHIKFIVELLKFRILLYSDGEWKKFGDFSSEDTPLFVIEKKVVEDCYKVVLTLKE